MNAELTGSGGGRTGGTSETDQAWLLKACGQFVLSDGTAADSIRFPGGDIDWEAVVEFANRHKLDLLFFKLLRDRSSNEVPEAVSRTLETRFEGTRRRNLSTSAELLDIVDALETQNVRVLAYKGPVIASRAYGDVSLRRYVDLDLLVPPSERERAISVLEARGFEQQTRYKHLFESVLKHRETGTLIDLHTQVVPKDFPFELPVDELFDRRTAVDIGGRTVPTFEKADAVMVHVVHGTKHCWYQAEWLLAVASLVSQISLSPLLDRAREVGCDRMLLCALELVDRLLGADTPVPADGLPAAQTDTTEIVRAVADDMVQWIHAPEWATDERSHLAMIRLQMQLFPNWKRQCQFLINTATLPQENDREFVSLPSWLTPLYRVIRPFRLAYAYRKAILR